MGGIDEYSEARTETTEPEPAKGTESVAADTKQAPRLKRKGETAQAGRSTAVDSSTAETGGRAENSGESPMGATMRIEGAKIMAGVLTAIECNSGMEIPRRATGKMIRSSVSDPA